MGAWDNLSIREKADMMKAAIRNGITTLPEIKQAYNEFAEGGNIYDGTKPHSSQMQKKYIYDVLPGLFAQDGVKISVTSGYRPGAVVKGTNKPSRHGLKQAADIVGDFDAIRRVLDDPNSNTSKWLLANGYGYLDETSKTGTTKFWHDKKRDHSHYHIGTDSGIVASYAKKMQKLLSELPQQQETVSMLPTAVTVPEFIPYNPQAFFGQQEATVQVPIESVDVPQEQANTIQSPTEQNNNFSTFSTIMGLLNAATPQESVPVVAQAQAKASSPYIVNRFDKGGSKKSGGSFYQTHRARWFNFLCKKGVNPVKAERLASYFSAQDALESGHGTSSAARQKNNYGGMQRLDKKTNKMVNVSYGSINDYMNAKWKMMNSKYSRALDAKSVQEYANILNDPKYHGKAYMYGLYEGYRDGQPLDVARQTKYMNDYTRIMMDIAGEKGFKGADVPDDLSIVQPENPYTQFIPFEPFNPQVFNNPQAFVAPTREQFEVKQPIIEAAKDYAYSPEQLEKEERRQGLNNLSFILGMMNGGNGNSFADTIGMLTGNIAAEGGKIHIKPENRGKFTALKKRTGHSATWFKEHGTPAQRKMATFALNARHWKHGYGGHIYDGTSEDTQQMNIPYAGELPDVTVMPRRIANKAWDKVQERWVGDMPTYYAVNPETGKEEMLREIGNGKYSTYDDKHVFDVLGAETAKKQREQWIKNGGNASDFDKVMLGTLGLGLAPIALPEAATGIWAASQTPAGQTLLAGTLGGEAWEALNHGITGQSWGDNLGDVIGLDKNNYLGRTALGLANPFYGLSPSMIYRGGEAVLGAGKTALDLAKNTTSKSVEALQNKYPAVFDPYTSWDATLGYHGDNIFSRVLGTVGRRYGYTPKAEIPEFHRRLAITRPESFRLTDDGKFIMSSGRTGEGHEGIVNFATSEAARSHNKHKYLSGIDDFIVHPKALENANWKSIQPSDTFLELPLDNSTLAIDPKYITFVSGEPEALNYARSIGMKTLSSPKLRALEANKPVFSGLLNRINNWKGAHSENARSIGNEIQRLTSMRGAPTMKDYAYFEDATGLNSGVVPSSQWTGINEEALFGRSSGVRGIPKFNNVAYDPATPIESIYRKAKTGEIPWSDYYEALGKMPSARQQLGLTVDNTAPQITAENAASVVSPQNEGLVVSAVPDYRGEIRTDYNLFRRFADRGIPQKTVKSIETPSNNIDLTSNILIDPDKRFMMFEPGKFINHDIGAMSVEEVVNTFGPEAEYYKKLYDVAKAHNFEGKYAKIGQDAEYNILNRFAINKADPDVAKGIAEARSIYDIPEYRARFNRWGTLGDTFVDDALARIDNVKLQGRSKNLDIKGQHGVHGGAYTSPDATTIGITNSESSSWITDNIRHEANHVGHGLNRQPGWMRYHNEKIRPIVREGKTTDTPLDKYYDEMDEIVERSKTAVEYANKIRKEGETLDQALTRLADMTDANIYNAEIPADIRQSIARYTKDSVLNFWKNFVGGYAAPIGLGLTGYGLYNSGK